ncbi:chromatin associated protein KTI12, partial [Phakopsora pachyrhizi]
SFIPSLLEISDSRTERVARANFLSSTIRQLSKDQIVVCDGMNYIKGFRYQLYCAAREAGIRTCTIHIANLPERCLANNMKLPEDNRYDQETISNFFSRYEEPNSAVRWDSPLVVLPWCDSLCENGTTGQRHGLIGLEGLRVLDDNGNERRGSAFSKIEQGAERNHLEGTHGANDDLINPKWSRVADDLWLAITAGEVKPVHAAVKPATQTSANFLHLLESTTTALIESFISALKDSPESYGTVVFQCSLQNSSQPKKFSLSISPGRTINVGVLQRLKRQYTTIHKQANAAGKGASENDSDEIADNFVKYLQGAM